MAGRTLKPTTPATVEIRRCANGCRWSEQEARDQPPMQMRIRSNPDLFSTDWAHSLGSKYCMFPYVPRFAQEVCDPW